MDNLDLENLEKLGLENLDNLNLENLDDHKEDDDEGSGVDCER